MLNLIVNFNSSAYGIIALSLFFISVIARELNYKSICYLSIVTSIYLMMVMFGLRDVHTGTDTQTYYVWFNSLGDINHSREFEMLFTGLGWITFVINDSPLFFMVLVYFITITFIIFTLKYKQKAEVLAVSVAMIPIFIPGSDILLNGVRNGLAIAIGTYASIKFLYTRCIVSNLILIAISCMFHTSAVIYFSVFLCMFFSGKKSYYLLFSFYLLTFFIEQTGLFNYIFSALSEITAGKTSFIGYVSGRVLAFKYQRSDMFSDYTKYYFFALTLIPFFAYQLYKNIKVELLSFYYLLMLPYAFIFSAPSSYRFSYLGYVLMVFILSQAFSTMMKFTRLTFYLVCSVMIFITYSTNTVGNYSLGILN